MYKNIIIIQILISLLSFPSFILSQDIKRIEFQLDSLKTVRLELELSLDSVNQRTKHLETIKLEIEIANDTTKGIIVKLSSTGNLRNSPLGYVINTLPQYTQVLVIDYLLDGYYKVKYGGTLGYINEMFLPNNEQLQRLVTYKKSAALSQKETIQFLKTNQHKDTLSTNIPIQLSKPTKKNYNSSTTSNNRTIHTGPRGGKYYINSKGKKVYIQNR